MANAALIDIAYQILKDKKKSMDFLRLLNECSKKAGITNPSAEVAANFYTKLTVDGRFMCLENNQWILKAFLSNSQLINEELDVEADENIEDEVEQEEADEYPDYENGDYGEEPSKLDIDYDEGDREEDSDNEEDY